MVIVIRLALFNPSKMWVTTLKSFESLKKMAAARFYSQLIQFIHKDRRLRD